MATFFYPRRVEFCETDAAGIVHFTSLIQYAEQAEHALLRSLGASVFQRPSTSASDSDTVSWPRVRIECDFQGAAYFEDELMIEVQLTRIGTKSVTYAFKIRRNEDPIATLAFTNVCCRIDQAKKMTSIPIPDMLRAKLAEYRV